MLLSHHPSIFNSPLKSRFNLYDPNPHRLSTAVFNANSFTLTSKNHQPLLKCTPQSSALPVVSLDDEEHSVETLKNQLPEGSQHQDKDKSFWGAVSLIIGKALGPGMLGLPAATIKPGPLPATIAIVLSWVYVISTILLVAELSFALMEEDGVEEVSFTGLATKALGAHALFPLAVGTVIVFFPLKAIDVSNQLLCFLMLFSITALVAIVLSVDRANVLGFFAHGSWNLSTILPAIPVTVLTLGFHLMVLSWNLIVLGLAGNTSPKDPISLLLSVNPSALSAAQGFALSALATSLIGYAVSFPKQLLNTLELILGKARLAKQMPYQSQLVSNGSGRVGFVVYLTRLESGNFGKASFGSNSIAASENVQRLRKPDLKSFERFVMPLVLTAPVLIASFCRPTILRALDFAGVTQTAFSLASFPLQWHTYSSQGRSSGRRSSQEEMPHLRYSFASQSFWGYGIR
ncbi:putative Pentatricopeptide repeat superfamily protein [Hibiscus syriacus]|uniref:Pentatricopeptide repeat superfamily protein n=1 Tax=Hibiscus syriacus TaxID=106335 RepID=A0A6A2YX88_HIBSY|nr:putative Pentatricopeptide repeat superfamily protein [Hibiscus syriacus]